MPQIVQPELLRDFRCGHCIWQILLVGEDQKHRITHLVFIQHFVELLAGIFDAIPVIAVNHVDQAVRTLVVVAPERSNLVLATNVPHLGSGKARSLYVYVGSDGTKDNQNPNTTVSEPRCCE